MFSDNPRVLKQFVFITVFLCAFLCVHIPQVQAVGEPVFISEFGSIGYGDGQFQYMRGIAADSAGNIYVVDQELHNVQKFNAAGEFISEFGTLGSGDGEFQDPKGIAVDASGNIYVTDSNLNRVQKFNAAGTYLTQWGTSGSADGQFSFARDIAVDSSGNVYVVDPDNYRVQKFDANGNFITKWGTQGSGDGQFNGPGGIAIDPSGNVFVTDTTNNNIQKFSSTGTYISQFGTSGSGNGQFTFAYGIAINELGDIFVADTYEPSVQKFSANGVFIAKLDSTANNGDFSPSGGVAVTPNGNVYFANGHNVLIYDAYNSTLSSWFNDPPFVVTTTTATFSWFTSRVASSSIWYGVNGSTTATSSGTSHTATITGLTPGTTYVFETHSIDALGNTEVGEQDSFTTNVLPIITSATTTSIASTTATVTWGTSLAASSKVVYSIDNSYSLTTTETDTSPRVTNHSVALSSLVPCTTYNMKVVSKNAQLEIATSSSQSFTTTGCVGNVASSIATSTIVSSTALGTTTLTDVVSSTTITVNTPSGFTSTSSEVVIQIRALNSDTTLVTIGIPIVSGLQSIGDTVFDIKALINNQTLLDSFDIPVTVTYTYSDADVLGFIESTISMYHYHDGTWSPLDSCVVDTVANTITCTAPNFSIFGLFGTLTPTVAAIVSTSGGTSTGWSGPTGGSSGGSSSYSTPTRPVVTSTPAVYTFTRSLSSNNIHSEVKTLQQFLNKHGYIVATAGAGSPGKETTKFGPATRAALIRFQKANGITPAVGFFGPVTRKVVNNIR